MKTSAELKFIDVSWGLKIYFFQLKRYLSTHSCVFLIHKHLDVFPELEFIDVSWWLKRYIFNWKDIFVFSLFINHRAVFPKVRPAAHASQFNFQQKDSLTQLSTVKNCSYPVNSTSYCACDISFTTGEKIYFCQMFMNSIWKVDIPKRYLSSCLFILFMNSSSEVQPAAHASLRQKQNLAELIIKSLFFASWRKNHKSPFLNYYPTVFLLGI